MTFDAIEISQQSAQPIEIYDFGLADDQYTYTSAEDVVEVGGVDYLPIAIERGKVILGTEFKQEILTITMPSDVEPADRYISIVPGQQGTVTIRRFHSTDGDEELSLVFKGVIRSVSYIEDGSKAQLGVVPLSYGLGKEVPRMTYQSLCNHVLYDDECKVSQSSYDFTGTVSAVSGSVLTVPGLNGYSDGYWTGGFVQYLTTDWRLVLDHSGNDVTLLLPFPSNVDNKEVTVFAGCDHTPSVCNSKFGNLINYLGFYWLPTKNIFESGID
jgi:uncharacterized phage protein (TIGR02218 family)